MSAPDSPQQELVWVSTPKDEWRVAPVVSSSLTDGTITVGAEDTGAPDETFPADETHVYDVTHALDLEDLSQYNNLHEVSESTLC